MERDYNDDTLDLVAGRFKVLGEPMRLRILNALRDGEHTVSELVDATDAGQANVSKHLNLLHRNGLVDRRKEGLNVFYSIADPGVFRLCDIICDGLEADLTERMRALGIG